tara:strand:+ start:4685 stop:8377 length:3693 start_codon:yes stop_codon:yes gene_type:complete
MPYERQTRSTGFRGRTGVILNSNKLAQQARQLDKDRVESVKEMGKQASSVGDELSRIFQIADANDEFNLQQLAKFSDTLNQGLETAAKTVGKDYITQKREEGIIRGRKAANGDTSAFDLDEEQNAKIEEAVAKQRIAVLKKMDKFDEEAYRATLEEKARALNLRRMGANIAWGYKRGYLDEKAKGWNAYRTTMLGTSDEVIGEKNGKEIVVGKFWTYDPETQNEILRYVEDKFIAEATAESGINQAVINKHLIKPVTKETGKFQEEVLNVAIRDEAKEEYDTLKLEITSAVATLDDKEKGQKTLRAKMDTALGTLKSITRRMSHGKDLQGTLQESANNLLANMLVEAITNNDANYENIDELETFLLTEKYHIPGITKKGESKLLQDIWPSEFNTEVLIGRAMKAYNAKLKEKDESDLSLVKKAKASILSRFYDGTIPLSTAMAESQVLRDKYEGVPGVNTQLFNLDKELKEPKYYTPEQTKREIEGLLSTSVEGTITFEKLLNAGRLPNQEVVDEYREKGLIVDKAFLVTDTEIELAKTFDTEFEELINQKVLGSLSKNDRELVGTQKVVDYARKLMIAEAKDLIRDNPNLTVTQAVKEASTTVKQALLHDHDDDKSTFSEIRGQKNIFEFDAGTNRWLNEELNDVPLDKTEQAIEKRQKTSILEQTFEIEQNTGSGEVDLLSTKSYVPPEYFKLTNGEPLPIFQKLADIDSYNGGGRNRYEIYNLQAALHEGIEPIEIPESVQKVEELKENLTTANKEIITNNASTRATGRVYDEVGIVDTANLLNTLAYDGQTLVTVNEAPALLKEAGLNDMSYEELLNNPKALEKVTKAKLLKLLEIANKETDNKNVALRMVATGMAYGEDSMGEWNTTYRAFSSQAAKNYITGDYAPLSSIGGTSVLIADGRFNRDNDPNPVTRTLPTDLKGLNAMLFELESMEKPSAFLDKGKMSGAERAQQPPITGLIGDFFNLNRSIQPNPEYAPYQARVQRVKDLITIHKELGTLGVWDAKDRRPFAKAMIRVIGQDRWNQLINEALDNPAWGSRGAGVQIISALVQGLPEFSGTDFTYDDLDASLYTLDSEYSGQMPENTLVNLDNNASAARQLAFGRDFKIRKDVAPDLIRMVNDARLAGHNIQFTSGYRSYQEQAKQHRLDPDLALPAGQSQHGLGTAIDINLPHVDGIATKETIALHKWLMENKHKYNFNTIEGLNVNIGEDGVIPDEAWHFEWRKPN